MVARKPLVIQESRFTDGRVVRALEDRGPFVHFVEHRLVDHRRADSVELAVLLPEEPASPTWNLVEWRTEIHVVPAKPGKDDRQIVQAVRPTPGLIGFPLVMRVSLDLIKRAKQEGVKVVFVQAQFSTRNAETVAQAIGGRIVQIDPLAKDYLNNMRKIAETFRKVIQ